MRGYRIGSAPDDRPFELRDAAEDMEDKPPAGSDPAGRLVSNVSTAALLALWMTGDQSIQFRNLPRIALNVGGCRIDRSGSG